MGTSELSAVGNSKVYSDDGHTSVPLDVRIEVGLEKGDKLRWVVDDGVVKVITE